MPHISEKTALHVLSAEAATLLATVPVIGLKGALRLADPLVGVM